MTPLVLLRLRPAGSAPADSENVKGPVPPVMAIKQLYALVSVQFGSVVAVMTSAGLTVRLSLATLLSLLLPSSCKAMPSEKVPVTVGVPLMVSVVPDKDAVKPLGKPVTFSAL